MIEGSLRRLARDGVSARAHREQILGFRRRVGALDERLPPGAGSLRQAAWAGLQDSMPRAALLSIHARVEGAEPASWEDPSLVQLWGPRYQVYVVAACDLAPFSLGRLPDDAKGRQRAQDMAALLHAHLGGARMPYGRAGDELGVHSPNSLRYGATTGTVADPLGGSARAGRLDGAAACGRPARGTARARAPLPARPRPRDAGGLRQVGRGHRAGGGDHVRVTARRR